MIPTNLMGKAFFFLCRKDFNHLMMLDKGICTEIKEAEKTVAHTEQKCADTRQCILKMIEQEKTEKDQVTDIVHTSFFPFFKLSKVVKSMFSCFLQILQLKLKIEEGIQKNNKLKKQLVSFQGDIERTVSIVVPVQK